MNNEARHQRYASFTEHRVPRGQGKLYARELSGAGPAFVLMHGFPDHLGIYDDLFLSWRRRGRVVTFDFLGFGRSDRPAGASDTFEGQVEDLSAGGVALKLGKFVPVVHDSSGPAGINYALAHRTNRRARLIRNSGYDDNFPVLWPEMVTLFATKELGALAQAVAQSPQQFGWLLGWQKSKFSYPQPAAQRDHFNDGVEQLIADNFTEEPSSGLAFMQLASHFFAELARNRKRLPELRDLDVPVKVIWGELDPYITAAVGRDRASHFRISTFHPYRPGIGCRLTCPISLQRRCCHDARSNHSAPVKVTLGALALAMAVVLSRSNLRSDWRWRRPASGHSRVSYRQFDAEGDAGRSAGRTRARSAGDLGTIPGRKNRRLVRQAGSDRGGVILNVTTVEAAKALWTRCLSGRLE